ncbi:elongation factor-like GTPase 1 isoform X2 [Hylaeus volcanicus]|uniref:elongation factor-like GTPase 1 isoform X2 n=1 Tax=Hylaeus volcanicus TaxID=313075 RepID=UPI0023B82FF5|nr:elongation factor-like GTPase 1 isoform X2 [Hylaeus volcanicus]
MSNSGVDNTLGDFLASHSQCYIKNVCVIAHVDHGKTSICDFLISTNGFITPESAGKVQFLDSREDEHRRSITMKSSCVGLHHKVSDSLESYLINLVDCPGHVDFSCDVASMVNICDGVLLIIDVVEGIRSQTKHVAEKAYKERLQFILIFNKMDKLFTELKLSSIEVVVYISNLIQQVNTLFERFVPEKSFRETPDTTLRSHPIAAQSSDPYVQFSPEKGNVVFCSAHDGWAFTLPYIASNLVKKLNLGNKVSTKITKALWGSHYLNSKTFTVSTKPFYTNQPTMAEKLVFEPIQKMYQLLQQCPNLSGMKKTLEMLSIDYNTSSNETLTARSVFSKWFPLEKHLMNTIINILPNPPNAMRNRIQRMFASSTCINSSHEHYRKNVLDKVLPLVKNCSSDPSTVVIVYITKFLGANLRLNTLTEDHSCNTSDQQYVGLSRIFSGILRSGMMLYLCKNYSVQVGSKPTDFSIVYLCVAFQSILNHLHTVRPAKPLIVCMKFQKFIYFKDAIYYLYNQLGFLHSYAEYYFYSGIPYNVCFGLFLSLQVCAGHIVAVYLTLQTHSKHHNRSSTQENTTLSNVNAQITSWKENCFRSISQFMTLSTDVSCPPILVPDVTRNQAIVRVQLEPKHIDNYSLLLHGLKNMYQADPSLEVDVSTHGELILSCFGEVHLEKCINDLENVYAKIPVQVSDPIIFLRETLYGGDNLKNSNSTLSSRLHPSSLVTPFPPWNCDKNNHIKLDCSTLTAQTMSFNSYFAEGILQETNLLFRVFAEPLPGQVLLWLEANATELQHYVNSIPFSSWTWSMEKTIRSLWTPCKSTIKNIQKTIQAPDISLYYDNDEKHNNLISKEPPSNILLGVDVNEGGRNLLYLRKGSFTHSNDENLHTESNVLKALQPLLGSIRTGFQLACRAGPLSEETILGVAFSVSIDCEARKEVTGLQSTPYSFQKSEPVLCHETNLFTDMLKTNSTNIGNESSPALNQYSLHSYGATISFFRDLCRQSFLQRGRLRIFEAMLHLELVCDQGVLGKAYSVLSKRRSQIISETINDQNLTFNVNVFIPMSESFGLAKELRSKASGHITLQLQFSHWKMNTEEPFPETCLTYEVTTLHDSKFALSLKQHEFWSSSNSLIHCKIDINSSAHLKLSSNPLLVIQCINTHNNLCSLLVSFFT